MRFVLDGGSVGNCETLHRVLAAGLQFPDWYGGNLDALHDCLTEINQPTELVIRGSDTLETALGSYAAAFRRVLTDSAAQNDALTVTWETDI